MATAPISGAQSQARGDARSAAPWVVGLFCAALALRLIHVATIRDSPFFEHLMLDLQLYEDWGKRIAAGDWLGDRPFFQDPLYAYFLGGIFTLVGPSRLAVVLLQALLGALVAALTYASARLAFDETVGRASGIAAALYLPAIYYEGLILKTALALFLVSVALTCFLFAPRARAQWLLGGFVTGLACLTRGNLVLFLPVLALWILLDAPEDAADRRPTLRERLAARAGWLRVAVTIGAAVAVLAVAGIRNRVVGEEWILTTANAGQNFYIGNNPLNIDGEYQLLPFVDANPASEERDFAREAERRASRSLSAKELSRFWFSEATSWIRADPGAWTKLLWRKLRNYWAAYEIPDSQDYYLYRKSAPVLRLPLVGFGLLAPLALLGAILALSRPGWPRLLVAFVVIYSTSVVLFFVFSRFRMAMMPALYPLAGLGAVELWRRVRIARDGRSSRSRAVLAIVLCLGFAAFVHLPIRGTSGSWPSRVATRLGLPTRPESSATAHYNLGLVYAARAKKGSSDRDRYLKLAEAELGGAVRLETRWARMPKSLGNVLARQKRDREAIEMYRRAAELEPNDYRTHHALGLLERRVGDSAAAEAAFRRALTLAPRHAASAVRLGELLLEQGRREEAAEIFRYALRLAPESESARRGLLESAVDPG